MSLKIMLIITAALGVLFGVAFAVAPVEMLHLYGVKLDPRSTFVPRYIGAAFIGIGAIDWFARDIERRAAQGIVLGNFVYAAVGLVVAALNAVFIPGTGLVWMNIGIYFLLAAGYSYFLFAAKEPAARIESGTGRLIPH